MSIIESARLELERVNFGEEDSRVMVEILRKFFDQWDSGGAVFFAADVLRRLISCQPITPLTGEDSEWFEVGEQNGVPLFQNSRCPSVFKEGDRAYDLDVAGRPTITFPYDPETKGPPDPVINFGG